jgi:hypothetical protein
MSAANLSVHRVVSVRLERCAHRVARPDAFHTLDIVLTTDDGNEVVMTAFSAALLEVVETEEVQS